MIYRLDGGGAAAMASTTISLSARATLNDTEIAGSQSSLTTTIIALTATTLPITNSFIVDCAGSDVLKIKFTGNATSMQLNSSGSGTTATSASITIIRVS